MKKLIEKHLYIDLKSAIKEEADLLKKTKSFKAQNMNWEQFNPEEPDTCFFGQGFGQTADGPLLKGDELTDKHREKVGTVEVEGKSWGDMTPLETWSAYMWNTNKNQVKAVFDYIAGKRKSFPKITVGGWNFKIVKQES